MKLLPSCDGTVILNLIEWYVTESEIGTATVSFWYTVFRYAVFGAGCCTRLGDEMGLMD